MEYMSLATLVQYGTPVILFALIILVTVLIVTVRALAVSLKEFREVITKSVEEINATIDRLKNRLVWADRCAERHNALEKILDDHENRIRDMEHK